MQTSFILVLLASLCLTGCSETEEKEDAPQGFVPPATPQEAYSALVGAAERGDFGAMYDMMDSSAKSNWQVFVEVSRAQMDRLDPAEQKKWRSIEGVQDMREIFYRYASMTPQMWDHYTGDHRLLKVDTVAVVVVLQKDGQPSVEYFKWEDGGYRKTRSPEGYTAPTVERVAPATPPGSVPPPAGVPDANKR